MPSQEIRDSIERSATRRGGTHHEFSQSWNEIKELRTGGKYVNDKTVELNDSLYVGGMCHPMSMYWLALRQRGQKSFFDWLKPNGVWSKGAINVLVMKTIMYKNGKNNMVPGSVHTEFDDEFFKHYNLNRYGARLSGLDNVLKYLDVQTVGYHMISLSRDGGGHAVAAHVSPSGESGFFDPNYGDYVFPTAQKLGSFVRTFMTKSGYANKYTLAQSVETFR